MTPRTVCDRGHKCGVRVGKLPVIVVPNSHFIETLTTLRNPRSILIGGGAGKVRRPGMGVGGPFVGFGAVYPQWVGFTLLMPGSREDKLEGAVCVILRRG